jgi:hypothetical protein
MSDPLAAVVRPSGFDVGCAGDRPACGHWEDRSAALVSSTSSASPPRSTSRSVGEPVFPSTGPVALSIRPTPGAPRSPMRPGRERLSLSPATLTALGPGDRVVLPSANGSHCSALAAGLGRPWSAGRCATPGGGRSGSSDDGRAVAEPDRGRGLRRALARRVVATGRGGSARRRGHRDALGQGDPRARSSPEAAAAGAAFRSPRSRPRGTLAASVSGRELEAKGNGSDIEWAAALDISRACRCSARRGLRRRRSG